MAKYLLHLNPEPPNNMRRTSMPYHRMSDFGTEQDMIDHVIARLRSSETVTTDVAIHVVDEVDLPGGSVSVENDINYFFDAWEWSD